MAGELHFHEAALRRLALRFCGNATDAEDLVQDTFEIAHRRLGQFKPGTNVRAWLTTILHHRFIDLCRRKKTRVQTQELDESTVASISVEEPGPEPIWSSITEEQFRAAFESLDEDYRRVFELQAIAGRTHAEIASELNLKLPTVATRLWRARKRMRKLLMSHLPNLEEEQR